VQVHEVAFAQTDDLVHEGGVIQALVPDVVLNAGAVEPGLGEEPDVREVVFGLFLEIDLVVCADVAEHRASTPRGDHEEDAVRQVGGEVEGVRTAGHRGRITLIQRVHEDEQLAARGAELGCCFLQEGAQHGGVARDFRREGSTDP